MIEESFTNLMYNVKQKIGVIGNLFLPQSDKDERYSDSNIKPLEKSKSAEESEDGKSTEKADKSETSATENATKK